MIYSYELYKLTGCVIPGALFDGAAVGLAGERFAEYGCGLGSSLDWYEGVFPTAKVVF